MVFYPFFLMNETTRLDLEKMAIIADEYTKAKPIEAESGLRTFLNLLINNPKHLKLGTALLSLYAASELCQSEPFLSGGATFITASLLASYMKDVAQDVKTPVKKENYTEACKKSCNTEINYQN